MKKNEFRTEIHYIVKIELKDRKIKKIVKTPKEAHKILDKYAGRIKKFEIFQITKTILKTVQWEEGK